MRREDGGLTMTFLEKYYEDHPECREKACETMSCYECWDREMPEEATYG